MSHGSVARHMWCGGRNYCNANNIAKYVGVSKKNLQISGEDMEQIFRLFLTHGVFLAMAERM